MNSDAQYQQRAARQVIIMRMRFKEKMTLKQVAKTVGISSSTVSQYIEKAMWCSSNIGRIGFMANGTYQPDKWRKMSPREKLTNYFQICTGCTKRQAERRTHLFMLRLRLKHDVDDGALITWELTTWAHRWRIGWRKAHRQRLTPPPPPVQGPPEPIVQVRPEFQARPSPTLQEMALSNVIWHRHQMTEKMLVEIMTRAGRSRRQAERQVVRYGLLARRKPIDAWHVHQHWRDRYIMGWRYWHETKERVIFSEPKRLG